MTHLRIDQPAAPERVTTLGTLAPGDLFLFVRFADTGFSWEVNQVGPAPDQWEAAAGLVLTIRPDGYEGVEFARVRVLPITPEEAAAIQAQVAAFHALPTH